MGRSGRGGGNGGRSSGWGGLRFVCKIGKKVRSTIQKKYKIKVIHKIKQEINTNPIYP